MSILDRQWLSDKGFDVEMYDVTGRMIEQLYDKLTAAEKMHARGESPDNCPECGSDLEYSYDIDDYGAYFDKCPVCGWSNPMINPDL